MLRPWLLLAIAACACAAPKAPPRRSDVAPKASASASASASSGPIEPLPGTLGSVEHAATLAVAAFKLCDVPAARARFLTFEEMVSITEEVTDKAAYERRVTAAVAQRCREIGVPGASYGIRVISRDKLRAATDPGKLRRDVDVAIVRVALEGAGATTEPESLVFFKTDGGWKLSATR